MKKKKNGTVEFYQIFFILASFWGISLWLNFEKKRDKFSLNILEEIWLPDSGTLLYICFNKRFPNLKTERNYVQMIQINDKKKWLLKLNKCIYTYIMYIPAQANVVSYSFNFNARIVGYKINTYVQCTYTLNNQ